MKGLLQIFLRYWDVEKEDIWLIDFPQFYLFIWFIQMNLLNFILRISRSYVKSKYIYIFNII